MKHWSDTYVGRPYIEREADCAVLAQDVRAEVFGCPVALPTARDHIGKTGVAVVRAINAQIEAHVDDYATPTDVPQDGDAVLLVSRGRLDHIGVYCLIGREPWVLHADSGAGQTIRTRVRELPLYGYRVEGYYTWK